MEFCPSCERPVAQLAGECPHCGRPLGAAPAPGSAPRPPAVPGPAETGGESAEDGPLDLAFEPHSAASASPAAARAPRPGGGPAPAGRRPGSPEAAAFEDELPPEEIDRAAGVTRPGNALGAPLYAWRALRRLPALRAEVSARKVEAEQAERYRRESFAQWAKAHGRELGGVPELKPIVDAAVRAGQELQGFVEGRKADFEKFKKLDGALAEETKAAEAEKAKLAVSLAASEEAWRAKSDALARAKAKLRRADIELRNIERVAQGKVGEGTPHHARFVEVQQARAAAAGETAQAEAEERQARGEADRVRAGLADIDRRLDARRAAVRGDPARRRLEEEHDGKRRGVEDALSAATAQALVRKVVAPDSPDARRLLALRAAEEAARRAQRIHEAALARIDRRTIAIGLAIPAGVLTVLIVLIALLR